MLRFNRSFYFTGRFFFLFFPARLIIRYLTNESLISEQRLCVCGDESGQRVTHVSTKHEPGPAGTS